MISEVEITNIRSIEHMVLKAKTLVIIEGDNGVGKTSILKAIEAVFEGGHDPFLRRDMNQGNPGLANYAKKGIVKLTLDDGAVLLREITETRSTLEITKADGTPVSRPQEYVETLASGFGFDPLKFIAAKSKEKLAYLQRAMNLTFTAAEVVEITGQFGLKPAKPVDLDGLDAMRKQIYTLRTAENTLAKQADGTVERLSALAEDDATDWPAEIARVQASRDAAVKSMSDRHRQVGAEAFEARVAVNADIDAKIKALEVGRSTQLAAINDAEKAAIATVIDEDQPAIDVLTGELATAQERARKAAHNAGLRQEIETARIAVDDHKARSGCMTAAITALDKLKADKLEALPMPGVDFRGGEFYVNNLPFDALNDGQKFMVAFQVGALLPGSLGSMIADHGELLGPTNWQAFKDAAVASEYQVFVTRRTEGPLEVQTV